MDQEKIGKFICKCRKENNLTQQQLALKLNITDKAISKWENGRCLPDTLLLKPLCDELNITINDLLSGEIIDKKELEKKCEENIVNTLKYSDKIIHNKKRNLLKYLTVFYIIIAYFGFKIWCYNYYKIYDVSVFSGKVAEIFDKNSLSKASNNAYLSFDDLSIRNDFNEFYTYEYPMDIKNISYVLFDSTNTSDKISSDSIIGKGITNYKALFKLSHQNSYLNNFLSDLDSYKSGISQIKHLNKKYFEKKNITNDIELIKYLQDHKYVKNTIFTPFWIMRENYTINYLSHIIFPTDVNKLVILDTDYDSYLIKDDDSYEVNILDSEKVYSLIFKKSSYFPFEYIEELLGTITIK